MPARRRPREAEQKALLECIVREFEARRTRPRLPFLPFLGRRQTPAMYNKSENDSTLGCVLAESLRLALNTVREDHNWEQRVDSNETLVRMLHDDVHTATGCAYEQPDAFAALAKKHHIEIGSEEMRLARSTRSKAGAAEPLHQLPMEPPRQAADTPLRSDEPEPMADEACPTTRATTASADLRISLVESIDSLAHNDLLQLGAELSSEQLAALLVGHSRARRLEHAAHDVLAAGHTHNVRYCGLWVCKGPCHCLLPRRGLCPVLRDMGRAMPSV